LSVPHRVRGVKILKAVSSPLRLQILNLLFDRGPLSYTELMSSLKMNPSRDAGRFAYHLKFLLKADLIEADVEARKYCLTEMGKMVIDVADRIEKKAFKPKGMLIRTSRFALEEFDANRIANSLVREVKMPAELAQKVAKEAEKRLLKSKTKYLTAPLVREVANAILIEKGLEEYRHKLTRLGLPVHDVTSLLEARSKASQGSTSIHETAGEMVLKEYVLLNILPRDIADAHLSGSLHVRGLSSWILKPSEIMHDLRFFFQKGLNSEKTNALQSSFPPPQDLESALTIVFNVLLHSVKEIGETQTLDYFNVFLAPFTKGMDPAKLEQALRLFIFNTSQYASASLGLELTIPDFAADKPAIGPSGKHVGKYGDFVEESQFLASLILEIFAEECARKPLFNPKIILKMRPETLADEKAKEILLKAHRLASETGASYFANLLGKDRKHTVFSASGFKLEADLNGDWEIDTLRTGCLGYVTVNLPRITCESGRDKTRFFEIFRERFDMAARALEIKYRALKQHSKGSLPFLVQGVDGDQYFRLENCSRIVNLAGFKEAVEAFCEKSICEDEKTLEFAQEMVQNVLDSAHKIGRRRGKRLFPAILPDFEASERLARLDIERYGVAKVRFSGTREKPFYSTVSKIILKDDRILPESSSTEENLWGLQAGGNLTVVELGDVERRPDELVSLTKQIFESHNLQFLTYDRRLTYCVNCKRSWFGLLHKCPSCEATGTLAFFDRFALE
jgi:anaerobic ribonucleoside-triphosphate reductase